MNLEDTPLYEMYEDNTTDVGGGLAGNTKYDEDPAMTTGLHLEVPTPEVNDNNVNVSVILPRVTSYAGGQVIRRKIYVYGNAVGRTNDYPILNTR